MKTSEPKILSQHALGERFRLTRFQTRFGDVCWFINDGLADAARCEESVLFQGPRDAAKRWLRVFRPALRRGLRPRPAVRERAWLPDGWRV